MSDDLQRHFYNAAYAPDRIVAAETKLQAFVRRHELHRTDAVAELLPRGARLLDVGCGDGMLLARAAPRFGAVVGVDIADVQLAAARRRMAAMGADHATFVQANVDHGLPFAAHTFDAATAVAVLGFVFDPLRVLAELRRVLVPGGVLVIEVLNLAFLPRRLQLLAGELPRHSACRGWDGGHLHHFTQRATHTLLREQGFEVEHCTGSGIYPRLRTWRPSLLTGNLIFVCRRAARGSR